MKRITVHGVDPDGRLVWTEDEAPPPPIPFEDTQPMELRDLPDGLAAKTGDD